MRAYAAPGDAVGSALDLSSGRRPYVLTTVSGQVVGLDKLNPQPRPAHHDASSALCSERCSSCFLPNPSLSAVGLIANY